MAMCLRIGSYIVRLLRGRRLGPWSLKTAGNERVRRVAAEFDSRADVDIGVGRGTRDQSASQPAFDCAKTGNRRHPQGLLLADIVAKVFLGWRTKILRAADAFYVRRREGPYRFIQNRSLGSVVALKGDAAAEKSKDQLSRDF